MHLCTLLLTEKAVCFNILYTELFSAICGPGGHNPTLGIILTDQLCFSHNV